MYNLKQIDILRLIRSKNVGVRTFHKLIEFFGNASSALENFSDFTEKGGRKYEPLSLEDGYKEIEKIEKFGAKFLFITDENYPKILKEISDAPPVLTYMGNDEILNKNIVAIVGSRNCSLNAINFTTKIAKEINAADITICSGLARGVDSAAHIAGISNTIAVIAGGIDHIYPKENEKLYKKISQEGVILAELPIGSAPIAKHFPQRNRIISGLSIATLVIEAGLKSGSLVTARFALEQNREIFAMPGFPLDYRSMGSNKLLKEGANLLDNSSEVISYVRNYNSIKSFNENSELVARLPLNTSLDRSLLNDKSRKEVFDLLSSTPIEIEKIIEYTSLPYGVISAIILELELAGKIYRSYGNKISLNFELENV